MARVFWDTNLFIYLLEGNPSLGERTKELRLRMRKRGDELHTSTFTFGEVLVKPFRLGREDLANEYRSLFIQSQLSILPFDLKAAEAFARIRRDPALKAPDAIQLACAASAGIDLFITNDERLSQKTVRGIHFITSLSRSPV